MIDLTQPPWSKYVFNGMLSTQPFPNGNMVGATATALTLSKGDAPFLKNLIECRGERSGWFYNSPKLTQLCQIDDYIAVCSVPELASGVIIHDLREPFWYYTGFYGHLSYGAGINPNPYSRLAWAVSVILCTFKAFTVQDSYMQTALMVLTYERSGHRSVICDLASRQFKTKLKNEGMTMQNIFVAYSGLPDHPLGPLWGDLDKQWGLA